MAHDKNSDSVMHPSSKRLTNLVSRAGRSMRGQLFIDRPDYKQTVILAGTARSGTTWLQELLNFDNYYRLMFEPLHGRVKAVHGIQSVLYLPPEDPSPTYYRLLERILSGRIRHRRVDKYNRKIWVKQRLIKFIHVNLMLKWIAVNFPEIPIVLILRHPCAVASSWLRLGLSRNLDQFLEQESLMADHLAPFAKLLEEARDPFEKLILNWCVEQYVPLRQLEGQEFCLVFYERLVLDPQAELKRLCAFVGRPYRPEMLARVTRPSALAKNHSAILKGDDLIEGWRQDIRPEQVEKTMELLATFGLDYLYGPSGRPLEQAG